MTLQTEEKGLVLLPSREEATTALKEIADFQRLIHSNFVEGTDYGAPFQGSKKSTLLKPGAEKITKLLKLAEKYVVEKIEDWEKGFFHYRVTCQLFPFGASFAVAEGLGECNSKESKYRYRWVFESELKRLGLPKDGLPIKNVRVNNNWVPTYRIENDAIYDQVNTILKMAKKRALVDAALSVGRLSELFTQDLEDIKDNQEAIEGEFREVGSGESHMPESSQPKPSTPSSPPVSRPTPPKGEENDMTRFFGECTRRGIKPEDGLKYMGVKSWREWTGTLEQAIAKLPAQA